VIIPFSFLYRTTKSCQKQFTHLRARIISGFIYKFVAIIKEEGEIPNVSKKLETVLKHVEEINNDVNRQLIKDYHRYIIVRDTGTNYQKDNVKLIYMFAKFLKESKTFYDEKDYETILAFLDTRRKNKEEDPEQKWITT
jgi:hypothetical protein